MLIWATVLMASCLNSEDDVKYYDDAAITAFSLSGANMTKHTTSSLGEDSTYVEYSTEVSNYKFVIDQLKSMIYNVDSLPLGTNAAKILCSYSTKNGSFATVKSLTSDSLVYLSTSDTTDFSKPRTVTVFSSSGLGRKDYTITVNVHKEDADSFKWQQYPDCLALASLSDMRAYSLNGDIVVMGTSGEGTRVFRLNASTGRKFTEEASSLGGEAYRNAAVSGGVLYVLDGNAVRKSADARTFETVADNSPVTRLVAASANEVYGLTADNVFMASADGGLTWKTEKMDSETRFVPRDDISYVCRDYKFVKNAENVVLVGNRPDAASATDSLAVVWRKIVENDADSEEGKWAYLNYDSASKNPLKSLQGLTIVNHGDFILALGGKGIGGCKESAHSNIYVSEDGGMSWNTVSGIAYPKNFDKSAGAMGVCADDDNHVWIMLNNTGQVWRGRLNKVAWQQ